MAMRQQVVAGTQDVAFDDIRELRGSFRRHLVAANRSPRTVDIYLKSLDQFAEFLTERGMPTAAASISRRQGREVSSRQKAHPGPGNVARHRLV
jgi:hypothetical protein